MTETVVTGPPDGRDVPFDDHLPSDFAAAALRRDAHDGLRRRPRSLPPKWFYDAAGSALFERITELPEYYPTRAERDILTGRAADIVARAGCDTLVELGSGSSEKTRLLLDPLVAAHPATGGYVALDVSESALREATGALAHDYPGLRLHAVRADFTAQLDTLPAGGRRLVVFLGSTIGNLDPADRGRFLAELRAGLGPDDRFLLGADLVKSPDVLVPAYDDAQGVTAEFNRNVLRVLNTSLGADFRPEDFRHVAVWNDTHEWVEMRLVAERDLFVALPAIDLVVALDQGEPILTEISSKFRRESLTAELADAGFEPDGWWTDAEDRFSLSLWRPA